MKEIECYCVNVAKYKMNRYLTIFYTVGFVLSFASVVTTRFGGRSIFEVFSAPTWLYVVGLLIMLVFLFLLLNSLFETNKHKMLISKEGILIQGRLRKSEYEAKFMTEIFLKPEYNLDFTGCNTLSFNYHGVKMNIVIQSEREHQEELEELIQQIKEHNTHGKKASSS